MSNTTAIQRPDEPGRSCRSWLSLFLGRVLVALAFAICPSIAGGGIIITEVMYNPAGPDGVISPNPSGEWVEIYNNGDAAVDLGGWRLDDEDANDWSPIPQGSMLLPGEAAVIASNPVEFNQAWGSGIKVFAVGWSALANSASATNEILVILDDEEHEVHRLNWQVGGIWPASSNGRSIYLTSLDGDGNDGSNWGTSAPGQAGAYSPASDASPYLTADAGSPGHVLTLVPLAPLEGKKVVPGDVQLKVRVADSLADSLTVKFFGRQAAPAPPSPFTIVALPDTQYYSETYPSNFTAQTQWVVDHREELNIAYVAHLGDIVDNADQPLQWLNANAALSVFDGVPDLPLGLCVGNHDQFPNGDPAGTEVFNLVFPYQRYQSRSWYGGHYGSNNDNHYILFSASEFDFIAIHLEYDTTPSAAVLDWAGSLLDAYPGRRGIVCAHSLFNVGNPAQRTAQGTATYYALNDRPNLFLMLSGHIHGEGRRTDVAAGMVHGLLSDYQRREDGGEGWLRLMEFVPGDNAIYVRTYSPTLDRFERDADSEFTLPYSMGGSPFDELGEVIVSSRRADVSFTWGPLPLGEDYEWYATSSSAHSVLTGPIQPFSTKPPRADLDRDGDVDPDDFLAFSRCVTGPNALYEPSVSPASCTLAADENGKLDADSDEDGDIDQEDFGILQRCYSGPGKVVDPVCEE